MMKIMKQIGSLRNLPLERSERGSPPLGSPAVWHVCVNRYSRSLARSIFFLLSVLCWFSYGTLINSNNVIIWGIIQICKIFVYISGVAWRRKVGRGHKKKERKKKLVWKLGLGVLPRNFLQKKVRNLAILGISRHV